MRRGDLVTVSVGGDFGKPRPALVIQADEFAGTATATVLLLSGTLIEAPLLRSSSNLPRATDFERTLK